MLGCIWNRLAMPLDLTVACFCLRGDAAGKGAYVRRCLRPE
jgi:hypothetical protein